MINIYISELSNYTQADYTKQYGLLDAVLKGKIDKLSTTKQKMQSLCGYMLLYRAVFELYRKTNIKLNFNKNGKPFCDFCCFNISHSDDAVACAVSERNVGIDIQKIKSVKPREKYKFFTHQENEYVNYDKDLLNERYIEIFTKKEAAVKFLGEKISYAANIDTFSHRFAFKTEKFDDYYLTVCFEKSDGNVNTKRLNV